MNINIAKLREVVYSFEEQASGKEEAKIYRGDIAELSTLEEVLDYYLNVRDWRESDYIESIGVLFIEIAKAKVVS